MNMNVFKRNKLYILSIIFALIVPCIFKCAPSMELSSVKAASKIKISKSSLTLTVGKSKTVKLINANSAKVSWSSSNKNVATVKNGKITAKNPGNTTIKAKYKAKNYKCNVKVKAESSLLTPYQKYGDAEYNTTVQMGGYSYINAVKYNIYSSSQDCTHYVIYNLSGNYDSFSFSYGHCDNGYTDDCILYIYLDGDVVKQYTDLNSNMLPQNDTIDVSGTNQLKIECRVAGEGTGLCGSYALGNINFHKIGSSASKNTSSEVRVVKAITPYQIYGDVEYNTAVSMAGYNYVNAVKYDIYSSNNKTPNYLLYNLNGEYSTFSFTYGHCDNGYEDECVLYIFLDGELVQQFQNLNSEMMPQDVSIGVSGAKQMKIECRIADEGAGLCGSYALGKLKLK